MKGCNEEGGENRKDHVLLFLFDLFPSHSIKGKKVTLVDDVGQGLFRGPSRSCWHGNGQGRGDNFRTSQLPCFFSRRVGDGDSGRRTARSTLGA